MFRKTLLLIALCTVGACDSLPTSAPVTRTGVITPPPPAFQSLRGILRRVMIDSVEAEWQLEVGDSEMYRLIGGPIDRYAELENKEVYVVGVLSEGTFAVESCEEDTRLIPEYSRRLGRSKK